MMTMSDLSPRTIVVWPHERSLIESVAREASARRVVVNLVRRCQMGVLPATDEPSYLYPPNT